ncbi:DUF1801 domain-containing protein [Aquimarina pacifica]|uniref:DUF1801 domain-containing protein n=1 Tax=Aquimarina pacifica TaxID=1296415 RepID=UPI0004708B89|nr:DUF1801 domain-containing protein [Aquimarina pacifica]
MQYEVKTTDEYIEAIPEERREVMQQLRHVIKDNLPKGFSEEINYKMIGYVVPHTLYPSGYHCDPKLPLPFMNIASQKNFIAVYHNGIYAQKELMNWFVGEYPKHTQTKLDMGKSCIRFKKIDQIPLRLIGELASKMTPQQWIDIYESVTKNK